MPLLLSTSFALSIVGAFLPISLYMLLDHGPRETASSEDNAAIYDVLMVDPFFIGVPPPTHFRLEDLTQKSIPASRGAIDKLRSVPLNEIQGHTCCICRDELGSCALSSHVKEMPCKHLYHQDCLFTWLALSNTCPLCRYEIDTDNKDYNECLHQRMAKCPQREPQVDFPGYSC